MEKSEKVVKPVERDALEPIDSERLTLFEEANVFVDGAFALSVDSRRASACKPNSPASMLSFSSSASSLSPKSRPRTFFAYEASKSSRGRGSGRSSVAALDSMLVVAVFQLATAPLANHVSRRMEAEADWKALQVTADPTALEGLMLGFSTTGLGDPDPPGWVQLIVGTHPTLADRIELIELMGRYADIADLKDFTRLPSLVYGDSVTLDFSSVIGLPSR